MSEGVIIAVNRRRKRRLKEKLSMSEWCRVHLIIRSYNMIAFLDAFLFFISIQQAIWYQDRA